jgi:hypothetical protein
MMQTAVAFALLRPAHTTHCMGGVCPNPPHRSRHVQPHSLARAPVSLGVSMPHSTMLLLLLLLLLVAGVAAAGAVVVYHWHALA